MARLRLSVSVAAMLVASSMYGCAPMSQQARTVAIPAAPAAPAPVETLSDTGLFGIVLFKPFGGFPECPNEPFDYYKFHFNKKASRQYQDFPKYACFRHSDEGRIGQAPGGTEIVWVKWPLGQQPQLVKDSTAGVSLIDGIVHGVNLTTYGSDMQERDFEMLVKKFGKPSARQLVSKQNRMGAKYDIIQASWSRPGGVTLVFEGAESSLDSGSVTARSNQESERLKAVFDKFNEKRPKL
ncbi:hypothetical protein [Cupriavidus pinatubonensis]|uniref:Lipoprotein n=1 Tax=Cupriavidus pinatubonensis TaxID=248026 RepID=A0ABN7ZGC7_9BURK|nr:hypothetical protein [Cupriavidus pinatubonensis]CAG9185030.1 hypothetical protein LMG23994_05584 [Cupriavidus pinatubonensis]